jgi:RNA polymerase sigma-70 factor, ECF subfamily
MKLFGKQDLIGAYNRGEKGALSRIYDEYYHLVFRFVRRLTRSPEDAEDITSETFLKLNAKRRQFETEESLKAFLLRSARNAYIDQQKNLNRRKNTELEMHRRIEPETEHRMEMAEGEAELLNRVRKAIYALPAKCQQVFILHFIERLKNEEIAARLKISGKTVFNQCTSAIKKLRLSLRKVDYVVLPVFVASCYTNWLPYFSFWQGI